SPIDIRQVITAPAAQSRALQTLTGTYPNGRYRLKSTRLANNHHFWLTVWQRVDLADRTCVAVGESLPLPTGLGKNVHQGSVSAVVAVVPCQSWLALTNTNAS